MRWRVFFGVGFLVVSLGNLGGPGLAAGALPAGATSEARFIREAQRALRELGYRPGPIDGVVGPRTHGALVRYQRAERIPVTGYLDTETMVRLDIHERVSRPAHVRESEVSRVFESDPVRAAFAAP